MKAPLRLFEPITREQNRLIHAMARGSALPDRQLYSMVEELIGIPSITALSRQEASCLIQRMERGQTNCFLHPRYEDQMPGDASRFPNYRHIVAIRLIARKLGWSREHLKNWLKKYVKVASIAELDRQSARKAFLGLMQIQKNRERKVLEQ
jgi:ribosome-binding protein aMBF1 (putative translation factor)